MRPSKGGREAVARFGRKDAVTRAEPPFTWAYAWDSRTVPLAKGPARLALALDGAAEVRRGIDCLVLTTDRAWRPRDRGFPPHAYARYLREWAKTRVPLPPLVPAGRGRRAVPAAWELPKTGGRDFWYLGATEMVEGIPYPILISHAPEKQGFVDAYRDDPGRGPVFSLPVTGVKMHLGAKDLLTPDHPTRKWILDRRCPFVLSGNYGSFGKIPDSYFDLGKQLGDLWVGIISGEGSYLYLPLVPKGVPAGPDYKQTMYEFLMKDGRDGARAAISGDWASEIENPFERLILCLSVETRRECHRLAEAGETVIGAESASAMPYIQTQIAFVRGAARQYGRRWLWYWGASFGDAIRSFIREPYTLKLEGLEVDGRNEVVGPSLAHIRRTMLQAYMQGASFLYPEQGHNMFAAGGELNPMGWCYDEMARLATRHPDRGVPYTPVALLLDRAHGWEKYTYEGERIWGGPAMERSDRMIGAFFDVACFPFPANEGDPVDDLNVPWPNGYFGDVFDVIVTSPTRTAAAEGYRVVFCLGDTRLDKTWAAALKRYVRGGGTLVVNAEQLVPGLDGAFCGARLDGTVKEASVVVTVDDGQELPGTPFPYALARPTTARVAAETEGGDPVAMVNRVGKGQVILTTPSYMLGHDFAPVPYMARLLLELTSGLLPVDVRGNAQYHVNLHPKGYLVTLSHNEGIAKSSHGPAKLDRSRTSEVVLRVKERPVATEDWIGEDPRPWSFPNEWLLEYTRPFRVKWSREGEGYRARVVLRPGEFRIFMIRTR